MPVANNRLLTDDTGLALVNAIERIAPLQIAPLVVSIPTGQWSGSGNDYYISVSASNVTANSILVPNYDSESAAYLKGPVWCVPAAGSFTIHTSVVPSGTVNIMVQFPGTMGEAHYQVLADVYSTSQTYSKDQAVAKSDVINNLTIDDATGTKPAGQHEVYQLAQRTASDWRSLTQYLSTIESGATSFITYTGKVRTITFQGVIREHAEDDILMTLPPEHRPYLQANNYFCGNIGSASVVIAINGMTGNVSIYLLNGATSTARLYFSATYITS